MGVPKRRHTDRANMLPRSLLMGLISVNVASPRTGMVENGQWRSRLTIWRNKEGTPKRVHTPPRSRISKTKTFQKKKLWCLSTCGASAKMGWNERKGFYKSSRLENSRAPLTWTVSNLIGKTQKVQGDGRRRVIKTRATIGNKYNCMGQKGGTVYELPYYLAEIGTKIEKSNLASLVLCNRGGKERKKVSPSGEWIWTVSTRATLWKANWPVPIQTSILCHWKSRV